jgi:hypothetical protein
MWFCTTFSFIIYQVDKSCFHRDNCQTYTLYSRTFCGNENLSLGKMSGRSKVLPDKTNFWLFSTGQMSDVRRYSKACYRVTTCGIQQILNFNTGHHKLSVFWISNKNFSTQTDISVIDWYFCCLCTFCPMCLYIYTFCI